jgi:hypothetical protein
MMGTVDSDEPEAGEREPKREGKPDLMALLREWLASQKTDEDEQGVTLPGPDLSPYPEKLPRGVVIKIVKARGDLLDKERELLRAKLREAGRMDDLE